MTREVRREWAANQKAAFILPRPRKAGVGKIGIAKGLLCQDREMGCELGKGAGSLAQRSKVKAPTFFCEDRTCYV